MENTFPHLAILKTTDILKLEAVAVKQGSSLETLMASAGKAICQHILNTYEPTSTVVVCGPGNNGGDGYVTARFLKEAGWPVRVIGSQDVEGVSAHAKHHRSLWKGSIEPLSSVALEEANLIVDAIFGIGLSRAVEDVYADMIDAINITGKPVVSVDIPSGLNSNTGEVGAAAVQATETVTFAYCKQGLMLFPGRLFAGNITVADIGLEPFFSEDLWVNHPDLWLDELPAPRPMDHKYDRGHCVIVGGDPLMSGAACLAARGARRAGSGMVTIAAPSKAHAIYAPCSPGIIFAALESSADLPKILAERARNALLIGPGCSLSNETRRTILQVLALKKVAVIDAGGLSAFEKNPEDLFEAIQTPTILTPHEGEFTRLFPDLKGDKIQRARAGAQRSNAIIVLKGGDTVVASPDGRAAILDAAPPFLATAGTGDVLAGMVVGLVAQGAPAFEAACMGTWIHAECADRIGLGLIAEDIPEEIPEIMKELFGALS